MNPKGSSFMAEEEDTLQTSEKFNKRDNGNVDSQEAHKETKENINKHTHKVALKEVNMENNGKELCILKKVKVLKCTWRLRHVGWLKKILKGVLHLEKLFEDKNVGELINNLNL